MVVDAFGMTRAKGGMLPEEIVQSVKWATAVAAGMADIQVGSHTFPGEDTALRSEEMVDIAVLTGASLNAILPVHRILHLETSILQISSVSQSVSVALSFHFSDFAQQMIAEVQQQLRQCQLNVSSVGTYEPLSFL